MAGVPVIIEEQHPIPQQISAFQFRLVGDMTLKQFFQVAGGALVALIFYASGLPAFIKWPLIFISFGFGAALAFLPLEDRPLGKWILSFFRSIYSPTVFVWKKMDKMPQYFQEEAVATVKAGVAPTLQPVPAPASQKAPHETKLEEKEKSFLSRIIYLSSPAGATPAPAPEPTPVIATGVAPVFPVQKPGPEPEKKKVKKEVLIPQKGAVSVEHGEEKERPAAEITAAEGVQAGPMTTTPVAPVLSSADHAEGKQAEFSQEAAPPIPPIKPNTIVGQVVDPDGKIVEGAILEIKDQEGRSVRALKTNKLGHFMIVTSLISGKYTITTEKDGLVFEPISFEATGEIIPPIAIWAKARSETANNQTNT